VGITRFVVYPGFVFQLATCKWADNSSN